jgi:large subunit ribosomal protein L25
MADAVLEATPRSGRGSADAGRARRDGNIPAVVYGLGTDTTAVTVNTRDLERILRSESGSNTLISLQLDGANVLTLARQVQRHPVRHSIEHVDFIRIDADQPVAAEVPLHLIGDPEGVKDGGRLEQHLFAIAVEARPAEIPTVIEADVSALGLGGQLRVSDVAAPAGVTITADEQELVALISVPRGLGSEEGEGEGEGEGGTAEGSES